MSKRSVCVCLDAVVLNFFCAQDTAGKHHACD